MFDKNVFKNQFRLWIEENPLASEEEALFFCKECIPLAEQKKIPWLLDESIAWFSWRKENLQKELLNEIDKNKEYLC